METKSDFCLFEKALLGGYLVGWLVRTIVRSVGWLVGSLVRWFVWLVGLRLGYLVGWLVGLFVSCLVCWFVGVARLVGWFLG